MKDPNALRLRNFVEQSSWNGFSVGLAGVAALLLLLFMEVGPFCTLGIPRKPLIVSGYILNESGSDLRVVITRNGYVHVENDVLPSSTTVEAALQTKRFSRVVIEADRSVNYSALLPVFRAAQTFGVPVALVSHPVSVLEQATGEAIRR
jgi:biopolymer transport protein ExbD